MRHVVVECVLSDARVPLLLCCAATSIDFYCAATSELAAKQLKCAIGTSYKQMYPCAAQKSQD